MSVFTHTSRNDSLYFKENRKLSLCLLKKILKERNGTDDAWRKIFHIWWLKDSY